MAYVALKQLIYLRPKLKRYTFALSNENKDIDITTQIQKQTKLN